MKTYKKITSGFVTQTFCAETNKPISQNFTAGSEVDYENEEGDTIDASSVIEKEQYLSYDMVQPKEEKPYKKYLVCGQINIGEKLIPLDSISQMSGLTEAEIGRVRNQIAAIVVNDLKCDKADISIVFTSFTLLDE